MRDRVERWLGTAFGAIFLLLSIVVTVETISRKVLNISLQGADELGGYALAVGATIAFSLALIGRNHIRVDVFHERFSPRVQALLNWLSIVLMALFAGLIAWLASTVIRDTLAYQSVSQTPWATPLILPQAVWLAGLVVFAVVSLGFALRATLLLVSGRLAELNRDFHPRSAKEELSEELGDLAARAGAPNAAPVARIAGEAP